MLRRERRAGVGEEGEQERAARGAEAGEIQRNQEEKPAPVPSRHAGRGEMPPGDAPTLPASPCAPGGKSRCEGANRWC